MKPGVPYVCHDCVKPWWELSGPHGSWGCSHGKSSGKGKQSLWRLFDNLRTAARRTGWLCWSRALWKQQAHLLPSCVWCSDPGDAKLSSGEQLCISPPIWTLQADSALQMFPLHGRKCLCILQSVKLEICSWKFLTVCDGTCIYHRGVAGLIFFNTRAEK